MPARRTARLSLTLSLATSLALADPTPVEVTWRDAGVTFTVPAGFGRLPARDPTPDLLGTFRRERGGEGVVLLQFVHLGAEVPQRPLTEPEVAELRGSDPYPFHDARERARTLGFEVDSLAGRATINGRGVVRLATAVPLDRDSVRVVVMAPASREREAREVFRAVLASARGRTSWQTPAERAREVVQSGAAITAMALMTLYGALALAVFRRRDAWRGPRRAAMFAIGALWCVVAALVPWGEWWALARSLALAAAFVLHGWRMRRR